MMKAIEDKEAVDKRATEEVVVKAVADKEATDKRAVKEAAVKEAAMGAAGDSSVPGQVPSSAAGAKRVAAPSSSIPPSSMPGAKRATAPSDMGVWKPRFV
jgi:hypothetical protein